MKLKVEGATDSCYGKALSCLLGAKHTMDLHDMRTSSFHLYTVRSHSGCRWDSGLDSVQEAEDFIPTPAEPLGMQFNPKHHSTRQWEGEYFTLPVADKESGKTESKAALRIGVTVIKQLRTRKNDFRGNGKVSPQKPPELKGTISAIPLNTTNCYSLEGTDEQHQWVMKCHGQVRMEKQMGAERANKTVLAEPKGMVGTGNLMLS